MYTFLKWLMHMWKLRSFLCCILLVIFQVLRSTWWIMSIIASFCFYHLQFQQLHNNGCRPASYNLSHTIKSLPFDDFKWEKVLPLSKRNIHLYIIMSYILFFLYRNIMLFTIQNHTRGVSTKQAWFSENL